ncbi:hypothetical protein E0H75_04305 [Kribbella capetownensis]|uniref:DUF4352 domain-containing protein n=1 Tax=Kribbella capetownensis TaxID=1572659 RepID=A0A4R0K161_9ACTN|nr:hypothetical protein [Kribbella capetownensis]TCC52970.1 hypothetical protein E0H75_04305 [Kribbella capetownensis]
MTRHRAVRWGVQLALLLALLSTSSFLMLRDYIDNDEELFDEGRVTEVVKQGPVTIGDVEWKLDSLETYTTLVNDEGEEISLDDKPAGSVIVVAKMTVTPLDGLYMKENGFSCSANLRDDRGNLWQTKQPFKFALPTYCTNEDQPFYRNKPGVLAGVYVVPESAVPHLTGVVVQNLAERRRIILTP